jgi:Ca2+/H+ antiporter
MSQGGTSEASAQPPARGGPGSGLNRSESAVRRHQRVAIAAILLEFVFHADPILLFVISGVAVGGMAHVLGVATEQAGEAAGPRVSALLNATFGNAAS